MRSFSRWSGDSWRKGLCHRSRRPSSEAPSVTRMASKSARTFFRPLNRSGEWLVGCSATALSPIEVGERGLIDAFVGSVMGGLLPYKVDSSREFLQPRPGPCLFIITAFVTEPCTQHGTTGSGQGSRTAASTRLDVIEGVLRFGVRERAPGVWFPPSFSCRLVPRQPPFSMHRFGKGAIRSLTSSLGVEAVARQKLEQLLVERVTLSLREFARRNPQRRLLTILPTAHRPQDTTVRRFGSPSFRHPFRSASTTAFAPPRRRKHRHPGRAGSSLTIS